MRREQFRIGPDEQPRSPRAARLRELEEQPPASLVRRSVGRPARHSARRRCSRGGERRLAIDDCRRQSRPGWTTTRSAIGRPTRALVAHTTSPAVPPSGRGLHARSAEPVPSTGRGANSWQFDLRTRDGRPSFRTAPPFHRLRAGRTRPDHGEIPAVPGTISAGRNQQKARDNVLDAFRLILSTPPGLSSEHLRLEQVDVRLDLARTCPRPGT